MIKGLSDYEKYKVLRPVIGEHQLDENGFPIINKTEFREKEWHNIGVTGLQNASPKKKNDNIVLLSEIPKICLKYCKVRWISQQRS